MCNNKIMDQQIDTHQAQQKQQNTSKDISVQDHRKEDEVPSNHIRKQKVGVIISRRALASQDQNKQQLASSQKMSISSIGRVHTLPNPQPMGLITSNNKKKTKLHKHLRNSSRQQQLSNQINPNYKLNHSRSKSYNDHRNQLQRQLQGLLTKKSRLDQLKDNKNKLKSKLKQLEWKLKQIKNEGKLDSMRSKNGKYDQMSKKQFKSEGQSSRSIKHTKLKPITLKPTRQQYEYQITTHKKENKAKKQQQDSQNNGQPADSFYVGQLHHKCLNCNHFNLKIEDIRIPPSIKKQMKQLTQSQQM